MVIVQYLFIILFAVPLAYAKDIKQFTKEELMAGSAAYEKRRNYTKVIELNRELIKRFYRDEHNKIMSDMKAKKPLDADEVPESLMAAYWSSFNSSASLLKQHKSKSKSALIEQKRFYAFYSILSELEYRVGNTDKISESVSAHFKKLEDQVYKFSSSLYINLVSWQSGAMLKGPVEDARLIITNQGLCAGGDAGVQNNRFHFYIDACFLYGSGSVQNKRNEDFNYQQSDLPAYGIKAGPGASVIISTKGSRLGFRLPVMYAVQELTPPENPAYTIKEGSEISFLATLYSRWYFGQSFFNTEIGKNISSDEMFGALGLGRTF